jgi:pimeloyl-ACP methyl ester carboxylesterase
MPVVPSDSPDPTSDAVTGARDALLCDEYLVEGVRVERVRSNQTRPTPIVFVHGGFFGSDTWSETLLPFLAERGWEGHALNWRGARIPEGRP